MAAANLNYILDLEDEIALEGLDGITLEGLWVRLKQRPNFEANLSLDDHSQAFLWALITKDEEIFIYKLPSPRGPLVIFNRYEHMDPELGIVLEPEEEPPDLYPIKPLDDSVAGVRGSCQAYHDREDVTLTAITMTLQQLDQQYGQSLVLVASQQLRNKALCISTCIDKFYDLSLLQYTMLERIGRSRRMGEITQGKVSLALMGENPKSMFYHRKRLLKLNLITKQPHQQKGARGQTHNGSLLHLTRFYVERRSKFIMMIQRAVELLKTKPEHCAPYVKIKKEMGLPETSCRKLFKSAEFQRYVKFSNLPYRRVFPDATQSQWRYKAKDAEKLVRVMGLINPAVDPLEVCKVDEVADDDDDEEAFPGILDQSRIVWRESLLSQAYRIVEEAGPNGVSQSDMARLLGQTKLDSRTICRNLQRRNTVHSLMKDVGRQRVSRYVSHKFATTGHLTQEFRKERQKMMAMIEEQSAEVIKPSTSQQSETSHMVESSHLEGVEVNLEMLTTKGHLAPTGNSSSSGRRSTGGGGDSNITDPSDTTPDTKHTPKLTPDKELNSQGFVSLLEKIRLTYSNQKQSSPHVTTRMMKRANMIIDSVKTYRVIDDAFKLQKMIVQAETEEGYPVKMDKKSLNRLLDKLAKGGFLKNILVKFKNVKDEKMKKSVKYVVHPSITFDSPRLKSAIEQQKLKFLALGTDPKKESSAEKKQEARRLKEEKNRAEDGDGGSTVGGESEAVTKSVDESMQELKLMHQLTPPRHTQPPKRLPNTPPTPKKSGGVLLKANKSAKFVRMCELHKLLFYLVYGYEGEENLDQKEAWARVTAAAPDPSLTDLNLDTYPTLYCAELSWRMFIPPLPNHINTNKGWAFVCDVLLRLPLCIFVRLVSVAAGESGVEAFLSHPVKKNLLIKFLPPDLRQTLLQGRKYVTYVIDLINRLCYVGLVQYGQQIMKEKDQVFVYVNRHASLIDTTTSGPGYHQISADKEYVRKEYIFNCLQDVIQYWYDMWTISMHTPLGGHNCMQGKKITIQILDRKPQIMESLTARKTSEAPERDNGNIPGDGRGAGGLDSAMFAHLKRNWSSSMAGPSTARPSALLPPTSAEGERSYEGSASYTQYLMNTTQPSSDILSPKHRLAGLRNVRLSVYKPRLGSEGKALDVGVGLVMRQPRGRKRKRNDSPTSDTEAAPTKVVRPRGSRKPTSYQRELKMRKKSPKKPYYDEEDRAALRRMNKLRVDWSSAEDSFLLLCKVASCFLFPNLRSQMITFSLVRDLLHQRFPEARNKTSRACQRRINYIMKNPTTEDNVAIFLEEVKQDANIVMDFKQGPRLPRSKKNLEDIYAKMFRQLMNRLVVKFASSESRQCLDLPDSTQEFEEHYQVIMAASSLRNKLRVQEVASVSDIDFHVVNALIYSSLCSMYDRDSYAYQLFLAYQQFPQLMLNSVLTRMRKDQMISYKKAYNRSVFAQTCLPLSTSPFQLSVTYLHTFNFKYQYEIFNQAWYMLKQLLQKKHQEIIKIKGDTTSPEQMKEMDEKRPERSDGSMEDSCPESGKVDKTSKNSETNVREDASPGNKEDYNTGSGEGNSREDMSTSSGRESREDGSSGIGEGGIGRESREDGGLGVGEGGGGRASSTGSTGSGECIGGREDGVPIVILNEGGYCAAIVALMATKRLIFDIVIPEQIIMMDQQQPIMEDHHQSLLQRFSDHTQLSGRHVHDLGNASPAPSPPATTSIIAVGGDVAPKTKGTHIVRERLRNAEAQEAISKEREAIGKEEAVPGVQPLKRKTEAAQRPLAKRNRKSSDVKETTKETPSPVPEDPQEAKGNSTCDATSEQNIPSKKKKQKIRDKKESTSDKSRPEAAPEEFEDNEDTQDTEDSYPAGEVSSTEEDLDVPGPQGRGSQTSASRLGLYMMRDQLSLAEVDQINIQHAQELLVVNACEVTCRLRPPPHLHDEFQEVCQRGDPDLPVADLLLPLSSQTLTQVLERKKRVTLDWWGNMEETTKRWQQEGLSPQLLQVLQDIYQYIHSCKELGASITSLKGMFVKSGYNVAEMLVMLEEERVVVRVGVAVVRWVTVQHSRPWLIHTNKISRGTRQSVRLQGVYRMNLEKDGGDDGGGGSAAGTAEESSTTEKDNKQALGLQSDVGEGDGAGGGGSGGNEGGGKIETSQEAPSTSSSVNTLADTSQMLQPPCTTNTGEYGDDGIGDGDGGKRTMDVDEGGDCDDDGLVDDGDDIADGDGGGGDGCGGGGVDEAMDVVAPNTELKDEAIEGPITKLQADSQAGSSRRSQRLSKRSKKDLEDKGGAVEETNNTGGDGEPTRHVHSFMAMRKRRYKRDESVSKEMERNVQHHHNISDYEEISVKVRPWVRLNGTLNRRVVDRMLGSVLCLVMERPGISGRDIVRRFSPALQPAHAHDLLDTLVQLQCVLRQELIRSHPPSLFSSTVDYTLVDADESDCDDAILYEPSVDAVLKLAMFIGDKKYSQDFLAGDRR